MATGEYSCVFLSLCPNKPPSSSYLLPFLTTSWFFLKGTLGLSNRLTFTRREKSSLSFLVLFCLKGTVRN